MPVFQQKICYTHIVWLKYVWFLSRFRYNGNAVKSQKNGQNPAILTYFNIGHIIFDAGVYKKTVNTGCNGSIDL